MNRTLALMLAILAWLPSGPSTAAENGLLLEDETFQDAMRGLSAQHTDQDRLRHAQRVATAHRLSSLQVKAICARLNDDGARLEFATTAFPRTIDPENFYEVYDAFTTFSKVMRLHDRIRGFPHAPTWPGPITPGPQLPPAPPPTMTDEDIKGVVQALRKESFDHVRSQMARQILSTSQKKFLSHQVRQMMQCFDFEAQRLELAKFAYDYTLDRENYLLVNEAFDFSSSKDALARYIQSKIASPGARP